MRSFEASDGSILHWWMMPRGIDKEERANVKIDADVTARSLCMHGG